MHFEAWQWALLCFGSFMAGLAKGGIAGLAVLNVAIFALLLPARESVGQVLMLYICTDLVAVGVYRRHASWPHLLRLFPTAALGVILGYFALGKINDTLLRHLIGAILLVLATWELARRKRASLESFSQTLTSPVRPVGYFSAIFAGFAGGFTTMVANAAGPLMVLYFLAMGLPKMQMVGTVAWFFLVLNLFKAPFSVHLGLLNWETLRQIAPLVPFSIGGALLGRFVIRFIPQKTFEIVALILTLVACVRLLWP